MRRVLERQFSADQNEHGEGALAVEAANKFTAAMREGDQNGLAIARGVIAEIDGPHKQSIELSGEIPLVFIEGLDTPPAEPAPSEGSAAT